MPTQVRKLSHPDVATLPVSVILRALGDPVRLQIIHALGQRGEQCCGDCGIDMPKPSLSHHFRVLREAGIINVRVQGKQRCISLRRDELEQRLPGVLDAVLDAVEPL